MRHIAQSSVEVAPPAGDRHLIRAELVATQAAYLVLLDEIAEQDLRRQSGNPAWTVGEVLTHLTSALELLPREVARARQGKGMYNFPPFLRDPLNALLTRRAGRGQTLQTLRRRYSAATESAMRTLDSVRDDEFSLGANFWGEGFRDIAGLFAAQTDHLTEHGGDIRLAMPRLSSATRTAR